MSKEIILFSDVEVGNNTGMKFLFFKKDVDIEKTLASNKISFRKKKLEILY